MKKKIVSLCLCAALLAVAVIGGTLAYFTDTTEEVKNVFTMADEKGIEVSLDEAKVIYDEEAHTWKVDPEAQKRVAGNEYKNVYPGAKLPKDPTMHNDGKYDAYVRLDVTVSDFADFVEICEEYGITDLSTIFGDYNSNWKRYKETPDTKADTMTYSYLWTKDGAPAVLKAGADTAAIFQTITVPAKFTEEDMKAINGFKITAFGYAIQADGAATDTLITELKAMTKPE